VDDEKLKNQKIEKSPDQVIQQVIIMDKFGNVLTQQKYATDTKKVTLNVNGLSADMYVARIYNGKKWTSIKFMKK
jgi:S-adenosylmethionine hydrolase